MMVAVDMYVSLAAMRKISCGLRMRNTPIGRANRRGRVVAKQEFSFAFFEEGDNAIEIRRQFLRSPVSLSRM